MENLLKLKNIGRTSAFWLNTVGIHDAEQLRSVGPVEAFRRIDDRGIRTSKSLLYALQGALLDQHWNDIDEMLKQQLCDEAGLSNNG